MTQEQIRIRITHLSTERLGSAAASGKAAGQCNDIPRIGNEDAELNTCDSRAN
jgi:hypothetical protein